MEEKLSLIYPIIVEGKYDKIKLSQIVSSPIITLDGFSIFNNTEKRELLKRMSREKGVILLADSDRAGNFLRSKLKDILKGKIYNVYTPEVKGKERRKLKPSADGFLGVEGLDANLLKQLLLPFVGDGARKQSEISRMQFYDDGFVGAENSANRREKLAEYLHLPKTLTSKSLLEAINLLCDKDEYDNAVLRMENEK